MSLHSWVGAELDFSGCSVRCTKCGAVVSYTSNQDVDPPKEGCCVDGAHRKVNVIISVLPDGSLSIDTTDFNIVIIEDDSSNPTNIEIRQKGRMREGADMFHLFVGNNDCKTSIVRIWDNGAKELTVWPKK